MPGGPKGRIVSLMDLPMDPSHWRMLLAFTILSTPAGFLLGSALRPADAPPPLPPAAAVVDDADDDDF